DLITTKTALPSITSTDLVNEYFINPPLKEQKSIANFLDKKVSQIDNIISKTKESIEEYKKYKQYLITEIVTKGIDENIDIKDSGIDWIGDIPEHWDVVKMKNIANLMPKCNKGQLNEDTKVSFLPMENIKDGYFINNESKLENNNSSYVEFENEDILVAKVTPCFENGNLTIAQDLYNGFGFGSSELFVFRCNDKTYNRYLFYYMQNEIFM